MSKYRDILAGVLKHDYYVIYMWSPGPAPGVFGPKLERSTYQGQQVARGFIDGPEAHTSFSKNISTPAKSGWADQTSALLTYAALYGYDKDGDPHLVMQHGKWPDGLAKLVAPSQRPKKDGPKPKPKKDPKPEPTKPPVIVREPDPEPAPAQSADQVLPTPSSGSDDSGLTTGLIAGGVGLLAAIAVSRKKRRR